MSETVTTTLYIFTGSDLETKSTNIIPAMSSPHPVSACPLCWGLQHTLCNTWENISVSRIDLNEFD